MKDYQNKKQKTKTKAELIKNKSKSTFGSQSIQANDQKKEVHKEKYSWYIISIVIGIHVLLFSSIYNVALRKQIAVNRIEQKQTFIASAYPILKGFTSPDITAESAIIMEDVTKTILYQKNASLRFSMASTTKIMTAMVALEYYKPDDILTIYSPHIEGVSVGFVKGEKVRFTDMLYAMLLPSGNDAAYAIADNYPGGVKAFIKDMNKKASELQLLLTHYSDPAGLDDDGNFTTVEDLARLTTIAMANKEIAQIVGTKNKVISTVDNTRTFALENLNILLGEQGVTGVKTGTTQGAGQVLITSMKYNDHQFIIVVIKSEDRFVDTRKLLNLISNNSVFIQANL